MSARTSPAFDRAMRAPDARPATLVFLYSDLGLRLFSLGRAPALPAVLPGRYDAAARHDGGLAYGAGAYEALESSDRVLGFGALSAAFGPTEEGLLAALEERDRGELTVELDNADRYFSRLLRDESFLARPLYVALGFEALPLSDYAVVFAGVVDRVRLTPEALEVRARPGAPALALAAPAGPPPAAEFLEDYARFYEPGEAPAGAGGAFSEGFE